MYNYRVESCSDYIRSLTDYAVHVKSDDSFDYQWLLGRSNHKRISHLTSKPETQTLKNLIKVRVRAYMTLYIKASKYIFRQCKVSSVLRTTVTVQHCTHGHGEERLQLQIHQQRPAALGD